MLTCSLSIPDIYAILFHRAFCFIIAYISTVRQTGVPFGTSWFDRTSAETRTGQGYCSIRPVRVFLLRLLAGHGHFWLCASRLSDNCLLDDAVYDCWNAQLSYPAIRLGNFLPAHRLGLVLPLPHLPKVIPCSYWASFCVANLPSLPALYAVSVRQARVSPIRGPLGP